MTTTTQFAPRSLVGGELVDGVPAGNADDVDRAVQAARRALPRIAIA
jgi:acyl-CoA reductase-like NAD-dependent aldehyde dehydrogenase